ncbi:MAG: hypothetical protein H7196_03265 [candidate division SR1 bacterium]|nr:hypothetical protein [candidate division SR1 bacterium]
MKHGNLKKYFIRAQFISVLALLVFSFLGTFDVRAITIPVVDSIPAAPGDITNASGDTTSSNSAGSPIINKPSSTICTIPVSKTTIGNIAKITDPSHYPIIPTDCKGPISPGSLGGIITRAYGFISSLALNLLFFFIVYNGFIWIYSGIDGGQSLANAKRNLQSGVVGFGLILGAFIIVNTFVQLFVKDGTSFDISSFFNTNINK